MRARETRPGGRHRMREREEAQAADVCTAACGDEAEKPRPPATAPLRECLSWPSLVRLFCFAEAHGWTSGNGLSGKGLRVLPGG